MHTSNGERGDWMVAELDRGGRRYERVYPVGEDWIAGEWAAALRRCLGRYVVAADAKGTAGRPAG